MELKLYDTLTREKRAFAPLDPSRVRMYVCGPTVYDFAHIGNARPVIVFDVLFRLLRHLYGTEHVTYVRNITDVDDKINARAAQEYPNLPLNEAIRIVTEKTEKQFHEDVDALGCLRPTVEPRATEHITEMRELIERLVRSRHAYVEEDHVLFRVSSMSDYGRLSKRSLDEMIAGARVEIAPFKESPMDFVLWKPSKHGEPSWPSPCGIRVPGRPGWHIECSAMSDRWLWKEARPYLSERGLARPHQFDIHGGGVDLVFPHHENEIAQSCCAFRTPKMASYWMHNGFLQVEGEKMSKSLGNFVTIHELLGQYSGCVLRHNMLKVHYRQPIDWRDSELKRSRHILWTMSSIITDMAVEDKFRNPTGELVDRQVLDALMDDLNTPLALDRFYALASGARRERDKAKIFACTAAFLGFKNLDNRPAFTDSFVSSTPDSMMDAYFSVLPDLVRFKNYSANNVVTSADDYREKIRNRGIEPKFIDGVLTIEFPSVSQEALDQKIERLVDARNAARKAKNFKEADRIRDELHAMGVELEDRKDGTTGWRVKA